MTRRRILRWPKGPRFALGAVAVVLVAAGTLVFTSLPAVRRTADNEAGTTGDVAARGKPVNLNLNRAPFNPLANQQVAENPIPNPGAPLEDVVAYVKHGIVKIETSDAANNRRGLGSGFVIDARGLVATNYHVVSDAAKADVVFSDGTRYGIEGYTAIDQQTDLAILKLNGVPPNVKALELNHGAGPRDASRVYAIGHPHDNEFTTTGGIVGRVLHTRQLPSETRQWLTETIDDSGDDLWIQHDAKIAAGNSGGPLINANGEVLGVNSWVNQKLGLGYAIHAQHLHELMRKQETAVVPLKLRRRMLPEPSSPPFAAARVASTQIKQLRAQLAAKGWRPRSEVDCATFDELARTITAVKYNQARKSAQVPMPLDEQEAVVEAADEAVAALRAVVWNERDQILSINAHAEQDRQPYSGAFLFGLVRKSYLGDGNGAALLIQLVGSDKQFFLPLDEPVADVRVGDCVLVLGVTYPAKERVGDNPLKPTRAQILLSKVVLPVGK